MKRFFCPSCNRVRRQRRWPDDVTGAHKSQPEQRRGTCDLHREPRPTLLMKRKVTPWK